jgi:hypothetical protein
MELIEFEAEEFWITEAVVLPLHGFDFVIHTLQWTSANRKIVPGKNPLLRGEQRRDRREPGEWFHNCDTSAVARAHAR